LSLNDSQIRSIKSMLKEGRKINEVANALNISSIQVALIATQKENTTTEEKKFNETVNIQKYDAVVDKNQSKTISPSQPKSKGDIIIGYSENNEPVIWNPLTAPNPHLMVVGESGFGKTYGITGIICELSRLGLPTIIVDYSRSYEEKNFPSSFRSQFFKEVNIGRDGISLNPLEIRESDIRGPLSVAVRISGTFNRIYNIGVHQAKILREVIIDLYSQRGIFETLPETWNKEAPHLSDLANALEAIGLDEEDSRRKTAETTFSHISNFFAYNSFNPNGSKFNWSEAMGTNKIIVLQLNGLDGKTQKVVTDFLLWDIYSYMVSRGPHSLSCFLVLDEAHNLSFKADTPVDKIVREARKFGLAAVLASQQPEDFSGSVFSCTGTKICFQVAEQKGKFVQKIASKCKGNVNEIREILSTIPKFHVFVLADNTGLVCKVISHEERGLR
jgi:DNA phosphorothioation-dependent restriction protein DptH